MELESHLCFPSCGKLCVESGREWFCISSTGGACHTVLEARMVGTETSGGPKVHFSMKVNKNPCLCLQRQSGPSVTGPSVLTACHHLSHFCQLSPHDQAVLLWDHGQLAPGQSHQSPGTTRLPLLSWEAGTLVSLKGGTTQVAESLMKYTSWLPEPKCALA